MRKLAFLALPIVAIVAAAGGCSTEQDEPEAPVPTDGVTAEQLTAYEQLQASTQKRWTWMQHEDLKTPNHLSAKRIGNPVLQPGDDIKLRTIDVLSANKALWKMKNPSLELSLSKTEVDSHGMAHARFQQVTHGVPVVGAELMAHYDALGHLASIDANYISDLEDIDVNPRFAADEALAMVKADVLSHTPVDESTLVPNAGKLVVYAKPAKDGAAPITRLAYEYRVNALEGAHPAIWVVTVDAQTGDILHRYNNLQTVTASGKGVLGDTKSFDVSQSGTGFVMTDTTSVANVQLQTFTAKQKEAAPGTPVTSTTMTAWDTGAAGAGAAVDAHFNAAVVAKYYKTVHNRNAIDGAGGTMTSTVHFGVQFDNAAWVSPGMIYGDGGELFKALSVSVDVVGHEFTHGVTEATSALAYENQSGALNEAVSDIFGCFIEHSVKPDPVKNWAMGEIVTKNGVPLRDMSNPGGVDDPQPTHMKEFVQTQQDVGGVHINSGIINNAAFLMTVGGTNKVSGTTLKYGIGWEKSEKVWYQANTKYFMATTNFAQAAAGVQSAGKDVGLTQNELNIVDCAFKATGVLTGACLTITNPQSTTTKEGTGEVSEDAPTTTPDDGDNGDVAPKPTKKKKKKTIVTEESGCNTAGGSTSSDLGAFATVMAVVAAIGSKRRRNRKSQ